MSFNENQPRNQKGVPGAGTWRAEPNDEGKTELTVESLAVPVQFDAQVYAGDVINTLPEWPSGLSKPVVTFGYENDLVTSWYQIDDKFWKVETVDGGTWNTFDDQGNREADFSDWDEDDIEAVSEWSDAVHNRIDTNLYGAAIVLAGTKEFQSAVVSSALGETYTPSVAPVYTPEELDGSAVKQGTARAEKSLSVWFVEETGATVDTSDTTLQDALTDLMHWADTQGIDFSDVLADARRNFDGEQADEISYAEEDEG